MASTTIDMVLKGSTLQMVQTLPATSDPRRGSSSFESETTYFTSDWVPLEELCWVLDPFHCFHRLRCNTQQVAQGLKEQKDIRWPWADGGGTENRNPTVTVGGLLKHSRKGRFERHVQLAYYYDSMIQLFAEMCLDRSYNRY